VAGVALMGGGRLAAPTVVVTTGTFLRGLLHIGSATRPAGRMPSSLAALAAARGAAAQSVGDDAGAAAASDSADVAAAAGASKLSQTLYGIGFRLGRLKTGTPPRLDGRTIDYGGLKAAAGDPEPSPFSFVSLAVPGWRPPAAQVVCHETYTSPETEAYVAACAAAGRGWRPAQGLSAYEPGGMAGARRRRRLAPRRCARAAPAFSTAPPPLPPAGAARCARIPLCRASTNLSQTPFK